MGADHGGPLLDLTGGRPIGVWSIKVAHLSGLALLGIDLDLVEQPAPETLEQCHVTHLAALLILQAARLGAGRRAAVRGVGRQVGIFHLEHRPGVHAVDMELRAAAAQHGALAAALLPAGAMIERAALVAYDRHEGRAVDVILDRAAAYRARQAQLIRLGDVVVRDANERQLLFFHESVPGSRNPAVAMRCREGLRSRFLALIIHHISYSLTRPRARPRLFIRNS